MHTTTRTAPPLHSSGRDFCCIIVMHLLLLLNLTYLDVTLHKNIKHDRMYVHTFQHAPSNLEYDFLHTITHTHMNNISKLQWPLHIQIKFVELCLSEKLYSGIRSDLNECLTIWDISWIISLITYQLQNVYAPHETRFAMQESFISWTCFQHNRKCCFLLSSCRFCCWLYLCILTSSLNSSVLLFGKYIFQYYFNVIRDLSYKYPFLLTIYYVCYSLEWVVQILARAEMLEYYIKPSHLRKQSKYEIYIISTCSFKYFDNICWAYLYQRMIRVNYI